MQRTAPLPEAIRQQVVQLAREIGDVGAGEVLGISRATVARAGAGLDVRPSVATAITYRLALRAQEPPRAA